MSLDRNTLQKLKRYAQVFREAADRGANESDTVMYLVKFFEDVFGYDSLAGEISKEVAIKDRYCDFGIKLDGTIALLVEAKAAGNQTLREKNIEQAENYASRAGIRWVLLTNGIVWQLYHLTFNEGEGIVHDLAFEVRLLEVESNPDGVWASLEMLSKAAVGKDVLTGFWNQKKALAPDSLIRVLFSEPVLNVIRRELNRNAEARLELTDVFAGVKDVLSKDAILAAGDITLSKKRKRRRKVRKVDASTGQTVEIEEEVDADAPEAATPQTASTPLPPSPQVPTATSQPPM